MDDVNDHKQPETAPSEMRSAFGSAAAAIKRIGSAAFHGAVAGGVIFGFLGGFRLRMAFYGAIAGGLAGAGREIYKMVKEGSAPEPKV